MDPLVSIIIPLYNREKLLVETLNSVLKQSYTNWECLIVDDHSTDNSLKIAQEFASKDSRFICLSRPEERTKGANACRNYGFEKSSGHYINWFDSDDVMHPDFVKLKVESLNESDLDAIISKTAMFINKPTEITGKEFRTKLTDRCIEDFLKLNIAWYLPDVMWNRSFLLNKELFDENLMAGQDRDFHARMLIHEPKLKVIDSYLTFYRTHKESITSKIDSLKDVKLKVSHLYSVVKLVDHLDEAGKLSKNLRISLFKSMMKYLPFVINDKNNFNTLKTLLKKLSFPNASLWLDWAKIYLSYISFKLFGKGSKLLK